MDYDADIKEFIDEEDVPALAHRAQSERDKKNRLIAQLMGVHTLLMDEDVKTALKIVDSLVRERG